MPERPAKRTEWLWLTAAMLIPALLLATHLLIPLNLDNDLYQAMGWEIVAQGRLPYVGSWAHTLPGPALIHAMAILLFGNSAIGFRIFDVLAHIATGGVLYVLLRRWLSPFASLLAGSLWTLYYISEGYWLAGQLDGFAVLLLAIGTGLYFQARDRSSRPLFWLTGFTFGCLTLTRPTYGLFLLSIAIVAWRSDRRTLIPLSGGAALALILTIAPYCFIRGGLTQMYEAVIGFNLSTYAHARASYNILNLLLHPYTLLALLALIPTRQADRSLITKESKLLLLLYLTSGLGSLYTMGKFLVYHFDPIFAVLSVLSAYGIDKLISFIPWRIARCAAILIVSLVLVRRFYPFNVLHYYRAGLHTQGISALHYTQLALKPDSLLGLASEDELCSFLSKPGNDRGPIELCSITPAVRWKSERAEATRFTMIHALGMHFKGEGFTPFEQACRGEFLDSLRSVRPVFILLATEPKNLPMFAYQSPAEIVDSIAGVDSLLRNAYHYDTTIRGYTIYRRRD